MYAWKRQKEQPDDEHRFAQSAASVLVFFVSGSGTHLSKGMVGMEEKV